MTVDELAQIIRIVDGDHTLGAAQLAEKIFEATNEKSDWNKDRIVTALTEIRHVQNDILMVLDRGVVNSNVKARMAQFLRSAADDLEMMKVD